MPEDLEQRVAKLEQEVVQLRKLTELAVRGAGKAVEELEALDVEEVEEDPGEVESTAQEA